MLTNIRSNIIEMSHLTMDLLVRYEHKMYAQTDMFSKSAACFEFEGEVCHFSASSGSK